MKSEYQFSGTLWTYNGTNANWHFISLPQKLSAEIREAFKSMEKSWGRLPVTAQIGNTKWETSIWFDTKLEIYILPVKATIRKKEKITDVQILNVSIFLP